MITDQSLFERSYFSMFECLLLMKRGVGMK